MGQWRLSEEMKTRRNGQAWPFLYQVRWRAGRHRDTWQDSRRWARGGEGGRGGPFAPAPRRWPSARPLQSAPWLQAQGDERQDTRGWSAGPSCTRQISGSFGLSYSPCHGATFRGCMFWTSSSDLSWKSSCLLGLWSNEISSFGTI